MRVTYPQLDETARELLARRVADLGGSKAAVAAELSVARTSVSQALSGTYPGDTRHLRAKIIARYAEQVDCPALGQSMSPAECAGYRERPLSACSAHPASVRHWQACQSCGHNPTRPREVTP